MKLFQKHSETSKEGAQYAEKISQRQKTEIMIRLHRAETDGMTIREVADILKMESGTVSARFATLLSDGSIIKTTLKRGKPSGFVHVCKYFWQPEMGETGKKHYINEECFAESINIIKYYSNCGPFNTEIAKKFLVKWKLD